MLLVKRPFEWLYTLLSPRGFLSPGVLIRVLAFGLGGFFVWTLHQRGFAVGMPIGYHEVAGAIITLILAFRTTTAYSRFWEARTLWGHIVNACRNIDALVSAPLGERDAAVRQIATWVVVFSHMTKHFLRGETVDGPELIRLIPPSELERLRASGHPPLHAAREIMQQVVRLEEQGRLGAFAAEHVKQQVVALVNNLGGCERILRTPTPLGYVMLMRRGIALFLASLPLALVERFGIYVPLVTMMVAYPVLMIEALANELDDPFGHDPNDLPLTKICETIEGNLLGQDAAGLFDRHRVVRQD